MGLRTGFTGKKEIETMSKTIKRYGGRYSIAIALFACLGLAAGSMFFSNHASAKTAFDTLTLSGVSSTENTITLGVTAGPSGAPAGFSVQWMLKSEYDNYGWPTDSGDPGDRTSFCKASFSGQPGKSTYAMGGTFPTNYREVTIGNLNDEEVGVSFSCDDQELECGSDYVFRAFAHANNQFNRSANSANLVFSTAECPEPPQGGTCAHVHSDGYWKTHQSEWNTATLGIGTVTYSAADVLAMLSRPSQGNNGIVFLAHEVIAAKLNILNGCKEPTACTTAALASADAKIGATNPLTAVTAKGFKDPEEGRLHDFNTGNDPQCPAP
jgi:hypothetical protein